MNKAELIAAVAEKTGLSKKDSEKAVNAAFDTIAANLEVGEKVQLVGFGVFDNGDENKIAASKTFINFMANSDETAKAVKTSTYFSVKNSLSDLYKDDEVMNEYQKLMPYLGDYYQVTPGWAEARTAWWNMLQQVGQGTDVTTAVTEFCNTANAAASAS